MKSLYVLSSVLMVMQTFGCQGKPDKAPQASFAASDARADATSEADAQALIILSREKLPLCDATTEGRVFYIKEEAVFVVCHGTEYVKADIPISPHLGASLIRSDDQTVFGYLRGSDSIQWAETADGFVTGLDFFGEGYRVKRHALYFTEPGCRGDSYLSFSPNTGLSQLFYVGGGSIPHYKDESSAVQPVNASVLDTDGSCRNLHAKQSWLELPPATVESMGLRDGIAYWTNSSLYFADEPASSAQELSASYPSETASIDGLLYFQAGAASPTSSGREPWVSDGTKAGTRPLKDINPGAANSSPQDFIKFKDAVYFSAVNINGRSVWKTDGTEAGTVLVGGRPAERMAPVVSGDLLYFIGGDGTTGAELWVSDGTPQGTRAVKDICPGAQASSLSQLVPYQNRIIFAADDCTNGRELWVSDGSAAGTVMIKDINTGAGGSSPFSFVQLKDQMLFFAYTPATGREIWTTDGTADGTVLLKDIASGSANGIEDSGMTQAGGVAYFFANDGVSGTELWKTDGTSSQTSLLVDIEPGPASLKAYARLPVAIDNDAYWPYFNKLWRSNGTSAGTKPVVAFKNPVNSIRLIGNQLYAVEAPSREYAPVNLLKVFTGDTLADVETYLRDPNGSFSRSHELTGKFPVSMDVTFSLGE